MTNAAETKRTAAQNDLTELVFILDRSGSMCGQAADTIGGFNSMLEKQKAAPGRAYVSTVLFDDRSEVLHDRPPLDQVPDGLLVFQGGDGRPRLPLAGVIGGHDAGRVARQKTGGVLLTAGGRGAVGDRNPSLGRAAGGGMGRLRGRRGHRGAGLLGLGRGRHKGQIALPAGLFCRMIHTVTPPVPVCPARQEIMYRQKKARRPGEVCGPGPAYL